jgi:homoserine dehydrogenase
MSSVNVAVIGVGLVGKEFLNQLATLAGSQTTARKIRLVYASNSSKSVYNFQDGIPLSSWSESIAASSTSTSPSDLATRLKTDLSAHRKAENSPQSITVVVDNTSSDKIASLYPEFLKNGIDVITPNKKAYSSSQQLYEDIIAASYSKTPGGGRFLNESTVGAGLPIISTLKDLVGTGDKVCFHNRIH